MTTFAPFLLEAPSNSPKGSALKDRKTKFLDAIVKS